MELTGRYGWDSPLTRPPFARVFFSDASRPRVVTAGTHRWPVHRSLGAIQHLENFLSFFFQSAVAPKRGRDTRSFRSQPSDRIFSGVRIPILGAVGRTRTPLRGHRKKLKFFSAIVTIAEKNFNFLRWPRSVVRVRPTAPKIGMRTPHKIRSEGCDLKLRMCRPRLGATALWKKLKFFSAIVKLLTLTCNFFTSKYRLA